MLVDYDTETIFADIDCKALAGQPINWKFSEVIQAPTTVERSPSRIRGPFAAAPSSSPVDQIKSVLDVWVQSMRSGDLNAQMTCYAPMLERYFRSTNVDEPTLRKSKAAWMAKWTSATFDLSEITFHELGPDRFEVEFNKEWDATGSSHFTGASRNVLIFQRLDDAWKMSTSRNRKSTEFRTCLM